eukprot:Rhum_TRINITY_DN5566_c0_g1::Rhum_TRINITY_DN5566_c0_g1_i1::g.17735::m.17735
MFKRQGKTAGLIGLVVCGLVVVQVMMSHSMVSKSGTAAKQSLVQQRLAALHTISGAKQGKSGSELDLRVEHLEEVIARLRGKADQTDSLAQQVRTLGKQRAAAEAELKALAREVARLKGGAVVADEAKKEEAGGGNDGGRKTDDDSSSGGDGGGSSSSAGEAGGSGSGAAQAVDNSKPWLDDHGTKADPTIRDIICPAPTPLMNMEIPLEHLPRKKRTKVSEKYDRRAGNCNNKGLWSAVSREDHYLIMKKIGELVGIKKGHRIFDWGSGCGHKLDWFAKEIGTSGMGVDLSYKSLLYAWQNTSKANKYCHGDGSDLSWIPDDTFDAVFSFGSIFHVYNQTLMCRSYKEMVRIAKRGAKIYNGWSAEDEFPNLALYHCLRDTNVEKVEVLEELKTTFKGIKTFPTKWKGWTKDTYTSPDKPKSRLMRPISYSHLITK